MDKDDFIQKMIFEFNFIESLYECIRLINPIKKEVFKVIKGPQEFINADETCYGFWKSNKVCDNCISIRAYNQDKSFTKIEYNKENIYIVTAVPLKQNDLVIELLQNISAEYFDHDKNFEEIVKLIQKQNLSVVKNIITNIYNEQFIFERLPHDIATSNKEDINVALFIIKIKGMNDINNKYGYTVGDQIIEEVAKSLKSLPRHAKDWISSYRGIRFALVLYDINENQIGRICNNIYERINSINFASDGSVIRIEVGIGYHILKDKLITPAQFIEKATEMLKAENRLEGNENSIKRLTLKYSFTYREKEIALLLLKGKSNIEIASNLYIGLSTVKKHISSLFSKMDVKSRTELVAILNNEADI